jgi:hypothetical protein
VLLVVAAVAWPWLLAAVLRHTKHGMPGAVFLICVATQALVVLAATLGGTALAWAALLFFCLGLVLYVYALVHFDVRQVGQGLGDQWVAGGAMAISALAGSKLVTSPVFTGTLHQALRVVTLVLLCIAFAWYVVLLAAEFLRPRLHFDIRRWATVFPLGMTGVAALSVAAAEHYSWLHTPGQVLTWIGAVAWLATVAAMLYAGRAD